MCGGGDATEQRGKGKCGEEADVDTLCSAKVDELSAQGKHEREGEEVSGDNPLQGHEGSMQVRAEGGDTGHSPHTWIELFFFLRTRLHACAAKLMARAHDCMEALRFVAQLELTA